MIVKLNYCGWKYYEGEEVTVKYGQSFLSNIHDDVFCFIGEDLQPIAHTITKDFGVTIVTITNGSSLKTIFIPYNDEQRKVTGYILNNEGKTIDKIS